MAAEALGEGVRTRQEHGAKHVTCTYEKLVASVDIITPWSKRGCAQCRDGAGRQSRCARWWSTINKSRTRRDASAASTICSYLREPNIGAAASARLRKLSTPAPNTLCLGPNRSLWPRPGKDCGKWRTAFVLAESGSVGFNRTCAPLPPSSSLPGASLAVTKCIPAFHLASESRGYPELVTCRTIAVWGQYGGPIAS